MRFTAVLPFAKLGIIELKMTPLPVLQCEGTEEKAGKYKGDRAPVEKRYWTGTNGYSG